MAARIERNARTSLTGVSVLLKDVEIARDAIKGNIPRKGEKYDTNFDRLVLMELDEAFDHHHASMPLVAREPFIPVPSPLPEPAPAPHYPGEEWGEDEEFRQMMAARKDYVWPEYEDLLDLQKSKEPAKSDGGLH